MKQIQYYGKRISFSTNHFPMWQRGGLAIRENGGRLPHHCLDISLTLGKREVWLTIHPLGRLGTLTRWIPEGPRGRGFMLGWSPRGAAE